MVNHWSLLSMNKTVDEVTMTYREAQDAYEFPRSTHLRMVIINKILK